MKIGVAGGHSKKCPGASKYIDEYTEDRKVAKALIAELKKRGHTVVDCSNEKSTQSAELAEECRLANNAKVDLFVALHFNAYKTTSKEMGTECWYYTGKSKGKSYATKVSKAVAKALGLPNRGAKATTSLYVIRKTNMTAILVEICFVDSKADAEAYKKAGVAKVAAAIADAICGTNLGVSSKPSSGSSSSKPSSSKPSAASKKIDEDGKWGSDTTRLLQKVLGTYEDGVVDSQWKGWKADNPGLTTGWDWVSNAKGSKVIKAMQKKLGVDADGKIGPNTINALIKRYKSTSGATVLDGKLDYPSKTIKAMQKSLNKGKF